MNHAQPYFSGERTGLCDPLAGGQPDWYSGEIFHTLGRTRILEKATGVVAMVAMAMIYADRGDLAQAVAVARRAHAVAPWYLDAVAVLAALLRRSGSSERAPLERLLDDAQGIGDAPARAIFHLLSGNVDQGADWTEKAIDQRDLSISIYLCFVVSKSLRASPRWPKIAKKLNLEDKVIAGGTISS